MRFYLRIDDLTPFVDNSGHGATYQRITPILDNVCDSSRFYSKAFQERVQWIVEHCAVYDVYSCQLCNGWTVYNTFVFEFFHDSDALMFKFRWLT